jgi:hypothetical protein
MIGVTLNQLEDCFLSIIDRYELFNEHRFIEWKTNEYKNVTGFLRGSNYWDNEEYYYLRFKRKPYSSKKSSKQLFLKELEDTINRFENLYPPYEMLIQYGRVKLEGALNYEFCLRIQIL